MNTFAFDGSWNKIKGKLKQKYCRALRKTGKDVGAKPDRGSEGVMGEDGGPCEGRR
ncbi:MAG: hypothetical protein NTV08_08565 [Verrucomicrobia bacterium]|nr:hypothetical protein [Verrucomicrobiota bacterium]